MDRGGWLWQGHGIRVLPKQQSPSGGKDDAKTGEACQEYVYDVVKAYIDTMLKH